MNQLSSNWGDFFVSAGTDEPKIGDMDEGIIEGGEDSGDAENEFTCMSKKFVRYYSREVRGERSSTHLL